MAPLDADDSEPQPHGVLVGSETHAAALRRRHALVVETGGDVKERDDEMQQDDAGRSRKNPETDDARRRRRKRRRPRETNSNEDEEVPFWKLFLQVGLVLGVVCLAFVLASRWMWPTPHIVVHYDDDGDVRLPPILAEESEAKLADARREGLVTTEAPTAAPQPHWPSEYETQAARWDAYGVAATSAQQIDPQQDHKEKNEKTSLFWKAAQGLRDRFAERYGGEDVARAILQRGLTTPTTLVRNNNTNETTAEENLNLSELPPQDLLETACRLQSAQRNKRPFRMVFGGYSVTAGRGNHHDQAYPAVLETLLHTVLLLAGIPELHISNAALGGCPAFPYGWCGRNFYGPQPDVVSWDFSMNEAGGDPAGLEAYLRQVLQLSSPISAVPPKFIIKDTDMAVARRQLVHGPYYRDWGLADPVTLHSDPAARPFLQSSVPEAQRPVGFHAWRQFGTPPGSPGQALHHPAVAEHAFCAWLLTMHFLAALEWLVAAQGDDDQALPCPSAQSNNLHRRAPFLPPPMMLPDGLDLASNATTDPWRSILYGQDLTGPNDRVAPATNSNTTRDDNNDNTTRSLLWRMNPIHCRTSFSPIQSGNLLDIVVAGGQALDVDVMLPKSKVIYNRGWVLDLSTEEKKAKQVIQSYNHGSGLGYVDSKKALYGLVTSGPLTLVLPYEAASAAIYNATHQGEAPTPHVGEVATDWFRSVVVCQVHAKKQTRPGECRMDQGHMQFSLGGVNVTADATVIKAPGTLYLGKPVCMHLAIPPAARLVQPSDLREDRGFVIPGEDALVDHRVGLALQVTVVHEHILEREQACSVSHVIWEQVSKTDRA